VFEKRVLDMEERKLEEAEEKCVRSCIHGIFSRMAINYEKMKKCTREFLAPSWTKSVHEVPQQGTLIFT
jgi:hypothetical protein